ncbi:hypothetical protein AB1Y20_023342 [Prymnesium parvum]|uniref:Uncharacterized protein n=1 Tax=Prymnesium parvum TaxID=97485 RepID=A0AB34JFY4_PRYPA
MEHHAHIQRHELQTWNQNATKCNSHQRNRALRTAERWLHLDQLLSLRMRSSAHPIRMKAVAMDKEAMDALEYKVAKRTVVDKVKAAMKAEKAVC